MLVQFSIQATYYWERGRPRPLRAEGAKLPNTQQNVIKTISRASRSSAGEGARAPSEAEPQIPN